MLGCDLTVQYELNLSIARERHNDDSPLKWNIFRADQCSLNSTYCIVYEKITVENYYKNIQYLLFMNNIIKFK